MPISESAKKDIQDALDNATDPKNGNGIAGLVFTAIDKSGQYIAGASSGNRSLSGKKLPMDMDSVFWIASCTKMITGIAALQLVEQGKLSLDDHEHLYKICPELKDKKVLEDDGSLVDRKGEITIRNLLSHTAGFGYSFFNEKLNQYGRPTGWDEFSGDSRDYLTMPLVNHPNTKWEYGINIDWAGIAVERASGMTLDEYFKRFIFDPLGIKYITFFPDEHMRENLVTAQQREKDGSTRDIDHPNRRPVWLGDIDRKSIMCTGGAGCFAKPTEYLKILVTLLNQGESPLTKNRILKSETVDEMLKNQIPEFPNFARNPIAAAKPGWTNPIPQLYPQEGDPAQGWGLTFMNTIAPGPTGRGANTVWWAGILNCFWWADREKGVAGMIAAQIAPFADLTVMGTWGACEAAVYQGLTS